MTHIAKHNMQEVNDQCYTNSDENINQVFIINICNKLKTLKS